MCFVLKSAFPIFSPSPLDSGVQISKQNTHGTDDLINNNLTPVKLRNTHNQPGSELLMYLFP